MSNVEQIVNLPFLYVNGLQLTYSSNTALLLASGQCRDSSNQIDMTLSTGVTINCAVNGANGLDTGSLAATSTYAIYLIGDSRGFSTTAAIASLSTTAPVLPTGYDSIRLIGWMFTDGSSHILKFYVASTSTGGGRTFYFDSYRTALSGGTATTLTNVALTNLVPPMDNTPALLYVSFTPASAGNTVGLAPFGSTATLIPALSGSVASVAQVVPSSKILSKLNSGAPTIQYINSASSCSTTIAVTGFEYSI